MIRWALKPAGYDISEAANGAKGPVQAASKSPDLALLDVMMPGSIDGYEVCRRLRADAVLGARAIVMLTAQARDRDEETAINAGAAAFVRKPFSPLELSKLVERLLRASRRATPVHPSTGDPSL